MPCETGQTYQGYIFTGNILFLYRLFLQLEVPFTSVDRLRVLQERVWHTTADRYHRKSLVQNDPHGATVLFLVRYPNYRQRVSIVVRPDKPNFSHYGWR